MGLFTKIFKNSRRFYALRMASRLIGVLFSVLFFLFFENDFFLYAFVFFSITADIFIFKGFKLKESAYKNPDLFKNDPHFSLEKFDTYTKIITNTRLIVLSATTILAFVFLEGTINSLFARAFFGYIALMALLTPIFAFKNKLPKDYFKWDEFRGEVPSDPTTQEEAGHVGYIKGYYYKGYPNHFGN